MPTLGIMIAPGKGKTPPPVPPGAKKQAGPPRPGGGMSDSADDGAPKPPKTPKSAPTDADPADGDDQGDSGDLAQCHEDVQMIYQNAPAVGAALCKFIASLCRDEAGEQSQSDAQGADAGAPPMGGDQGGGGGGY